MNIAPKKAATIRSHPWLSMTKEISLGLRQAITLKCGVRRNANDLNALINYIDSLIEIVGRANPLITSRIIACAALAREESRGGHFRDDFPKMSKRASSSYLTYDMLS